MEACKYIYSASFIYETNGKLLLHEGNWKRKEKNCKIKVWISIKPSETNVYFNQFLFTLTYHFIKCTCSTARSNTHHNEHKASFCVHCLVCLNASLLLPCPLAVQFDTPALHQQSRSPGHRQLITTVCQLRSSRFLLVWLAPSTPCFCLYGCTNLLSTFFPPPTQSVTCKLFTPIQWSEAT